MHTKQDSLHTSVDGSTPGITAVPTALGTSEPHVAKLVHAQLCGLPVGLNSGKNSDGVAFCCDAIVEIA